MYALTEDLVRDHQQTLLAAATSERRGERLARSKRLHHRAQEALRRSQRAAAHSN